MSTLESGDQRFKVCHGNLSMGGTRLSRATDVFQVVQGLSRKITFPAVSARHQWHIFNHDDVVAFAKYLWHPPNARTVLAALFTLDRHALFCHNSYTVIMTSLPVALRLAMISISRSSRARPRIRYLASQVTRSRCRSTIVPESTPCTRSYTVKSSVGGQSALSEALRPSRTKTTSEALPSPAAVEAHAERITAGAPRDAPDAAAGRRGISASGGTMCASACWGSETVTRMMQLIVLFASFT